jgi:apolipoprotein N-acyltransferase
VPWLLLRGVRGREAFWWSWLIGFVFFLSSLWWLVHLTAFAGPLAVVAYLALSGYLALFFGAFGLLASRLVIRHQSLVTPLILLPSLWTALEFARSHLLSGFGWNLLAYSQTSWRTVIQLADLAGAWGLSFVIVLVNGSIASASDRTLPRRSRAIALGVAASCVVAAVAYGAWRVPQVTKKSRGARVAVAQGNIPQEQKWNEAFADEIVARYEALTRRAATATPDLVVWPETSVPGYFGLDEALTQRIMGLAAQIRQPLLVGTPYLRYSAAGPRLLNRATLLDASGLPVASYDKLHLVPFGEFVPGEQMLPWLRQVLPPIGEFSPGLQPTVFTIPVADSPRPLQFSVLICFEDIFPYLARRFVRQGAELLAVITNDAWFGPTAAAYQHAQASALRAVELRVPVIRAANTGWSGCIDATGAWGERVRDGHSGRELFVEGLATCDVALSNSPSLYRRWGDWFAWLCVAISILNLFSFIGLRQLTPPNDRPIMKG